jgi:hypothetical protein
MDEASVTFIVNLIKALGLTMICEIMVLMIIRIKQPKLYLVCAFTNMITNVSMNLLIPKIAFPNYDLVVIGLEIGVIAIEFMVYYWFTKNLKQAVLIAVLCNLCSYLVGMLLMPWIY